MYSSHRSGILYAALAMAATACIVSIRDSFASFAQACKRLALHFVDIVAPAAETLQRPAVAFVQAKAFVQRIVKRERPVMTASWRMCPSV